MLSSIIKSSLVSAELDMGRVHHGSALLGRVTKFVHWSKM